jgi:hypothetical protein
VKAMSLLSAQRPAMPMGEPAKLDFSLVPVIDIARELFGQEGRERSTDKEKHFPNNGGLFVNVQKNKWYSHGNAIGGDAVSLICFATSCDFQGALAWLRSRGYLAEGQAKTQAGWLRPHPARSGDTVGRQRKDWTVNPKLGGGA